MLVFLLASVGLGCCGADVDRDERHAAAAVVAMGVVDHLDPRRDADGDLIVDQVVRVDELRRGQLTSDWLRIPSYLAHRQSSRPWRSRGLPFPPGTEVLIVATPERGGVVPYSVCQPDVFERSEADVSIPPGPGAVGEGALYIAPWSRPAEAPPTGERVMVGLSNGTVAEAEVLGEPLGGGRVTLRVDVRGVPVVDVAPLDALLPVLAEPLPLGPELFARPGLLVRDGVVEMGDLEHPVPDEVLGIAWSEERAAAEPSGEPVYLRCDGDTSVHGVPGGPAMFAVSEHPVQVWATGEERRGWVQVEVATDAVFGRGWIREERRLPEGTLCVGGIGTSSHRHGPRWESAVHWVEADGREVRLDAPAELMFVSWPTSWQPELDTWAVIDAPTSPRIVRVLE